ncbi:MAG: hypothetical protein LBL77_02540 [Endomicrobium sp.]|nr:hypothetical protein [Endomicrobium sp.]
MLLALLILSGCNNH